MLSGCLLRQKQDSVSQPTPGCQRADTWPAFVLWGAMNVVPEQGVRVCGLRPCAHTTALTADREQLIRGTTGFFLPVSHPGVLTGCEA